ncbi:phage tail terminator-like protein [Solidesulfovibrio sp. C21]|uniref:phage tail terminator-like protein n=1 Tax=Solidesulfovibrio sp. C21 TaxID=3398613 RepID=UPI0039FD390D
MTPDAISQAIEVYFDANWTATPFTFGNLDPANTVRPWVCLYVLPGPTSEMEQGEDGVDKRVGVVKVQIFTPAAKGTRAGDRIGGQVEALFRKKNIGGVIFERPYTNTNDVRGADQQHTTTCPFWALVGE